MDSDFIDSSTICAHNSSFCDNKNNISHEIIICSKPRSWGGGGSHVLAFKYKQIGRKIAYYRRLKNLTQAELAQKINISTSYLSKIECGNYPKSVSVSVLMAIAGGLDIELYLLLKFDDEEMPWKDCT